MSGWAVRKIQTSKSKLQPSPRRSAALTRREGGKNFKLQTRTTATGGPQRIL
jgi:hypothetical protein